MNTNDIYEKVNARILEQLEEGGIAPWRRPWNSRPQVNCISKKAYRGVNVWLLPRTYTDNRWLTFKQGKELGGSVRKGEKGSIVVFWQMLRAKDEDATATDATAKQKLIPLLKYYTVFNATQFDGLNLPPLESNDNQIMATPESIIESMPKRPEIMTRGSRACYHPIADKVYMPRIEDFHSSSDYYAVLMHELAHSTGHPSRLGRFDLSEPLAHFGTETYAREELVAELTSAFLCGVAGIEQSAPTNSAAYIAGWREAIKNDPRMMVVAAGKAQKAADYILGVGEDIETDASAE